MSRAAQFFAELRHRKVVRTAVIYAALAWAGIVAESPASSPSEAHAGQPAYATQGLMAGVG